MKITIATSVRVTKIGDKLYLSGPFYSNLKRYYDFFGDITLCTRVVEVEQENENLIDCTSMIKDIIPLSKLTDIYKFNVHKQLEEKIKESDLVVIRVPSIVAYVAANIAKKERKTYYAEVIGCAWDAYWNHSIKGKIMAPYMTLKMKEVVLDTPYVVYVTNEFLQKRYPTKGKGIALSDVALNSLDDSVLEKRLSHIDNNDKKLTLGTTAAIDVKYKGQQYIIKALGELKKKGITNFKYEVVGNGDQTYLKKQIEENDVADLVTLKGGLPHDQVFEWLDSIDLYVQPSRQEGLPRALIEAMSRALPAFGARTGGIPELIDDKFIFSNTNKNIKEICDILMSFDKETLKEQAIKNFNTSKEYEKEVLNKRRNEFFTEFKNSL